MHRLGEIYVEYPRSSLSHSHSVRATKARAGHSAEALDMFDYMGGSLSPSRSRSIGRATNVSDRYFQPASPGQDMHHHRNPNHAPHEHHERATSETFRGYPLHGGEARDVEDRLTHWDLGSSNLASQAIPLAQSSMPLDPQDSNAHQSEVTSTSSLFGRSELRRTTSGRVGHGELGFSGMVAHGMERMRSEPETAGAAKHGMVMPPDTSSCSRLYECSVESNGRRNDRNHSICMEQTHGYSSRYSEEHRGCRLEDETQGSLPGTPATFSRIVAIGDEDSGTVYSSDGRFLARQEHQHQESQQQHHQQPQRHYDHGVDFLPGSIGNVSEASLDWSAQGHSSRSSTPQMRPEGVPRQSHWHQQHAQEQQQQHLQHHHQMQQQQQPTLHQQDGILSRRMQAASSAASSRDASPTLCGEQSNSSLGRCLPDTWSVPPNPPPRAAVPQQRSSTGYVYPNPVDRSTRSPSPNTLHAYEGSSRTQSRKSTTASLVHARSLSDGQRETSWAGLSPSASGQQTSSGRSSQRTKVPHSRGHSDVVLSGRWQGQFDGGSSGVASAGAASDGYAASIRAGSPVLPPTDVTLSRGSMVSTPSRGYSMTRHASRGSQAMERCPAGTICNASSGTHHGVFSTRDEHQQMQQQQQQQQQQQHKQRRRLGAIPDDSGLSRLNGRTSTGHCPVGGGGLNPMMSLAATAGGRIVSPDMTRSGSLDIEAMSGARRQVTAQRGLGSGGLLGREMGPQVCSSPLVVPSQPGTPPIPPPAPKNPTEWLQRLERTRTIKETAPTTPTTSRSSSMSSLASPAHTAAFGASLVESADGLRSMTASGLDVGGSGVLLPIGRSPLAGTCPAPDCPGTGNCLPGATPDMVVYEVRFKRATRTFLPGDLMGDSGAISCGDRVKVEADRGEDLGTVHRALALSEYLQALFEEKQAKAAKIAENGGGGGNGGGSEGEGGKKKRSKSKKNEDDASKNGSSKSSKQQQQKRPEESQEEICPVRAIKRILRAATEKELEQLAEKTQEEAQILRVCQTKVRNRSLPMKIVDAEYQFDHHKLTLFFEAERRIDFRELVRDLFAVYKTRIWMQQVKDKDAQVAKASSAPSTAAAPPAAAVPSTPVTPATVPVTEGNVNNVSKHLPGEIMSSGGETSSPGTRKSIPSPTTASPTAPVLPAHDADHDSGYGSSGSTTSSNGSTARSVALSEGRSSGSLAADGSDEAFDLTRSYVSNASGDGVVGGLDSPSFFGRTKGEGASRSASGGQGGFPNQWLVNMAAEPEEGAVNGFDSEVRTCLQSLASLDLTT